MLPQLSQGRASDFAIQQVAKDKPSLQWFHIMCCPLGHPQPLCAAAAHSSP